MRIPAKNIQWQFQAWVDNNTRYRIQTCGKQFLFHKQFNLLIIHALFFNIFELATY